MITDTFKLLLDKISKMVRDQDVLEIANNFLSDEDSLVNEAYVKLLTRLFSEQNALERPIIYALLALCSQEGIGTTQDLKKAFEYYLIAANQGLAFAQHVIGFYYDKGYGVEKNSKKAFEYFSLAANQSNAEAQFNVGISYRDGDGIEKDSKKAFEYCLLSAIQDNKEAQFTVACFYKNGQGVAQDQEKAIKYFLKAANQGHALAQFEMGVNYDKGYGVEIDLRKAFEYFLLAANQGHEKAQYNVGIYYFNGCFVKKDLKKAFDYYLLSANQGFSSAQYNVGIFYSKGVVVEKDLKQAFNYFLLAANQGNNEAQFKVGIAYNKGDNIEKDPKKSFEYFLMSANQGHSVAQYNLGVYYEQGYGADQDPKKAFEYYSLAANKGYVFSQYKVATYFEQGIGVKKDLQKAFEYYLLAANQGHGTAQYNLGVFYFKGHGVEKDLKKAFEYTLLAADLGNTDAQYNLGVLYNNGYGVVKDLKKAFEYYLLAANHGDMKSQFKLAICYGEGEGVEKDLEKAFNYCLLAANQGHMEAQHDVGVCYENGEGVERDPMKAFDYYTLAANQGHKEAKEMLRTNYEFKPVETDLKKLAERFRIPHHTMSLLQAYSDNFKINEESAESIVSEKIEDKKEKEGKTNNDNLIFSELFLKFLTKKFKVWDKDRIKKLQSGNLKLDLNWCTQILNLASEAGNVEILKELCTYPYVKFKEYIDKRDSTYNTPLIRAAARGNTEVFILLIQKGANIYLCNFKNNTALALAYKNNHSNLLKAFFNLKISLPYYDINDYSIIGAALKNNDIKFAKEMLANTNVNLNESFIWIDTKYNIKSENLTPLVIAIKTEHFEVAKRLLEIGAQPSLNSKNGLTPFKALMSLLPVNDKTSKAYELLIKLIGWELNPLNSTENSESDLLYMVRIVCLEESSGYVYRDARLTFFSEILELIISKCSDINYIDKKEKMSALMLAVQYAGKKAVDILLSAKADPFLENEGTNSLTIAPYVFKAERKNDSFQSDDDSIIELQRRMTRVNDLQLELFPKLKNHAIDLIYTSDQCQFPRPITQIILEYAYSRQSITNSTISSRRTDKTTAQIAEQRLRHLYRNKDKTGNN